MWQPGSRRDGKRRRLEIYQLDKSVESPPILFELGKNWKNLFDLGTLVL